MRQALTANACKRGPDPDHCWRRSRPPSRAQPRADRPHGRFRETEIPIRAHAVEFAEWQANPRYGGCASPRGAAANNTARNPTPRLRAHGGERSPSSDALRRRGPHPFALCGVPGVLRQYASCLARSLYLCGIARNPAHATTTRHMAQKPAPRRSRAGAVTLFGYGCTAPRAGEAPAAERASLACQHDC